jgi:hypothetical protein
VGRSTWKGGAGCLHSVLAPKGCMSCVENQHQACVGHLHVCISHLRFTSCQATCIWHLHWARSQSEKTPRIEGVVRFGSLPCALMPGLRSFRRPSQDRRKLSQSLPNAHVASHTAFLAPNASENILEVFGASRDGFCEVTDSTETCNPPRPQKYCRSTESIDVRTFCTQMLT